MAPGKRTERSCLLVTFNVPATSKIPLANLQDHNRVRRHCTEVLDKTLPDMIRVEVRPGADEGSWQVQVWECPDE